jgi:hypothetical protein
MPQAQPSTEEPAQGDLNADVVDKKLEETIDVPPTVLKDTPATNGDSTPHAAVDHAEEAPVAAIKPAEETPAPETVEKALEEEDSQETEKPKDPVSSPALTREPSTTKPAPAQPAVPAKPMSWANRVAAAGASSAPRPAMPQPKTASPVPAQTRTPSAPQQSQAAQPKESTHAAQPVQPAQSSAASTSPSKDNEAPQQGSGWQSVGDHAKRQNRPQSVSGPQEKEGTMGYVRYVTEGVKTEELRSALASFGELVYFDINRQKVSNHRLSAKARLAGS